ncbi:MAG TPA: acyl-CoA synthetase FdrA, partial [Xanthobacteraceae bacterium]|nr:acyl-CoA synthetase FdrA [Xanthobacteraceae bacterium]
IAGTPANKEILRDAGILGAEGAAAEAGDVILALRAADAAAGAAALAEARRLLDRPTVSAAPAFSTARTLRAAVRALPAANLALISVPGEFAVAEARKALDLGLHAMIFSDNVPIADEAALKRAARERGLMVMGPDCGTAIIAGLPLAFANAVPRGDIGIIGAAGTGIQEISCLIARAGRGVSHAIGTGGRDLRAEVGAITTLMALDALDADAATEHIVLVSKPPAPSVARLVLDRVANSAKPCTVSFIGAEDLPLPANARAAATLKAAAELAIGRPLAASRTDALPRATRGAYARGLYAGGTLCTEAQVVFRAAGLPVASNVPVPGAAALSGAAGHAMIDLGDDAYTRGRPHPMIEPAVRDAALKAALADPAVAVILIDVVLGYGAHPDPAGHLAQALAGRGDGPLIVASVTGTDADPQPRAGQVQALEAAGVIVADSNADAAALAAAVVGPAVAHRGAAVR